jgi:hypothetical protein
MGSGKAPTASRTGTLLAVPMALVGHETRAIFARKASASELGWQPTTERPIASDRAKTRGARVRHVAQSMQEESTKKSPGAFSGSRSDSRAMIVVSTRASGPHAGRRPS